MVVLSVSWNDVGEIEIVLDDDLDVACRFGVRGERVLLLERCDADGRRGERHHLELGARPLLLRHLGEQPLSMTVAVTLPGAPRA